MYEKRYGLMMDMGVWWMIERIQLFFLNEYLSVSLTLSTSFLLRFAFVVISYRPTTTHMHDCIHDYILHEYKPQRWKTTNRGQWSELRLFYDHREEGVYNKNHVGRGIENVVRDYRVIRWRGYYDIIPR